MGLIEKWKSRETKKKLREENIRLKELESVKTLLDCGTTRGIMTLKHVYPVPRDNSDVSESLIHAEIENCLMDLLKKYIEYDSYDDGNLKMYTGTIYVAVEVQKESENEEIPSLRKG